MKHTYQPGKVHRQCKRGFRHCMSTKNGCHTLVAHRHRGCKVLPV